MQNHAVRRLLYLGLVALYLLHNDLWYWHDTSLVLGLPIGLFYHIGFCFATCGLLYLLVTYAWPRHLEVETEEEPKS